MEQASRGPHRRAWTAEHADAGRDMVLALPGKGADVAAVSAAAPETVATIARIASATDGGTSGLAVTALIVGLVGLLVGAVGVILALGARRRAAAPVASAARERDAANV
ncbi:MAG: hypothetical protein JWP46_1816 [Modestobacter sp.]|jgi:hypothetical protein|nr:hypothetical protein [Modestobacter sp.]